MSAKLSRDIELLRKRIQKNQSVLRQCEFKAEELDAAIQQAKQVQQQLNKHLNNVSRIAGL